MPRKYIIQFIKQHSINIELHYSDIFFFQLIYVLMFNFYCKHNVLPKQIENLSYLFDKYKPQTVIRNNLNVQQSMIQLCFD